MLDVWGFWSSSDRLTLPAMKKDAWNQLSKRLSVIVCDQISAKVCCEALRRAILISPCPSETGYSSRFPSTFLHVFFGIF